MNRHLQNCSGLSRSLALMTFLGWSVLTSANAQDTFPPFMSGDIFVAVKDQLNIFSPPVIERYNFDKDRNPPFQFLGFLEPTGQTGLNLEHAGMAFDQFGNLYVTNRTVFGTNSISRYLREGILDPQRNPFVFTDENSGVESIVFDKDGNFYVGQAGSGNPGIPSSTEVIKYDPDGNFLPQSFAVETGPSGSDAIDLAADQTTLFYTSQGRTIKRYDLRIDPATDTGIQLNDFADLGEGGPEAFALRLLADGGLLVADTENIKRLNNLGGVTQSYNAPNEDTWFALNLDPDKTSFWSAGFGLGSKFYKFDIASGEILASQGIQTPNGSILGLTVFNELTQAVPPVDPGPGDDPIAMCQDVTVACEETVTAEMVDNGSFDPNGDELTFTLAPNGPFVLGTTPVTLTVENTSGGTDTCEATVTVVDTTPPVIFCNAPSTITKKDLPISFTAIATSCSPATIIITDFDCFEPGKHRKHKNGKKWHEYDDSKKGKKDDDDGRHNDHKKNGKKDDDDRDDERNSCAVSIEDDTITILDAGRAGNIIRWTVEATNESGETSSAKCEILVTQPKKNHKKDDDDHDDGHKKMGKKNDDRDNHKKDGKKDGDDRDDDRKRNNKKDDDDGNHDHKKNGQKDDDRDEHPKKDTKSRKDNSDHNDNKHKK